MKRKAVSLKKREGSSFVSNVERAPLPAVRKATLSVKNKGIAAMREKRPRNNKVPPKNSVLPANMALR